MSLQSAIPVFLNYRSYSGCDLKKFFNTSPREFFFWMLPLDIGVHTLQANLVFIENFI